MPLTDEQVYKLTVWVDEMHRWARRVRRDILAHEVLLKKKFPEDWQRLADHWKLLPDENAADADKKVQKLKKILDRHPSADPGDPPMPPLP